MDPGAHSCLGHLLTVYCVPGLGRTEVPEVTSLKSHNLMKATNK